MTSLQKSLTQVDREKAAQNFWCLFYASAIVAVYMAALQGLM